MKEVEISIVVKHTNDYESGEAQVYSSETPVQFVPLMLATEHMMRLTAVKAKDLGLSFDEIMNLLIVGTKHIKDPVIPHDMAA